MKKKLITILIILLAGVGLYLVLPAGKTDKSSMPETLSPQISESEKHAETNPEFTELSDSAEELIIESISRDKILRYYIDEEQKNIDIPIKLSFESGKKENKHGT